MHPRVSIFPFLISVLAVASPVTSWATAEKESSQSHAPVSSTVQQSDLKEQHALRLQNLGKHTFPVSTTTSGIRPAGRAQDGRGC